MAALEKTRQARHTAIEEWYAEQVNLLEAMRERGHKGRGPTKAKRVPKVKRGKGDKPKGPIKGTKYRPR